MDIPLLLTILAASTTILGGLFSVILNKDNMKGLGLSLSFSAGVMLYLSFMEILPKGMKHLAQQNTSVVYGLLAFFMGLMTIIVIDKLTPGMGHEKKAGDNKLKNIGFLTMILITLHNFPEGMAVYSVASESLNLSWSVIISIAIHNFPEGIVIAAPIYFATGNKFKAVMYSALSALVEPLGGVIGYHIFKGLFQDITLGIVFCFVAGIMIFLSIDQILPEARKNGDHHLVGYGTIFGMIFMAVSLYLLNSP